MHRSLIVMLLSSFTLALAACSGPAAQTPPVDPTSATPTDAQPAPTRGAAADECADKQPTGSPPTCPEGCIYDPATSKCKSDRGVIVDQ